MTTSGNHEHQKHLCVFKSLCKYIIEQEDIYKTIDAMKALYKIGRMDTYSITI